LWTQLHHHLVVGYDRSHGDTRDVEVRRKDLNKYDYVVS
jgi:hypothetical protein